ncbi:pygopus homolog 2 [Oryzias melastigma]|uniref:pygopus homolog 2 n=1 Tax=Oryzias melastigma TaxID=30732 RepID=UPI000CF82A56|nr:pygopus homolog 2 [Oryzias melastigma]
MAAESGRLLAGQGKRKASQMKSPEKKKTRKSTTQTTGFSHLTEFAPPPTPMVDHLVASNPFDDDFGPPSRPSGAVGPGGAPFLPSPGGGGGPMYGGRMGTGMTLMGGPGGPGSGSGRRLPFGPPSNAGPHHQLGFETQGPFPPSQDGPYPGPSPPGPVGEEGKNFAGPPGPSPQQQLNLNPNGPPTNNNTPGPPNASQQQPGGGFPGHPDVQQPGSNTPGQPTSAPPQSNPNSSPTGPLNGSGQPQHPQSNQLQHPSSANTPNSNSSSQQQQSTPPNSAPGPASYSQQNSTAGAGGPQSNAAPNSAQNSLTNNNGGHTPGGNPNPPPHSTSTPNTQSPLPPGPAPSSGLGPGKLGGPGMVFPCGHCVAEVHDDQDAILCEASCQRWFHRDCTGLTEPAYGLLTRESAAVWACDYCIKTKDIQAVFVRQGLGQLVAANES